MISQFNSELPKELTDVFEEYTEDDFNLYVTKAEYLADNFTIEVILDVERINDKDPIYQVWRIEAKGQRKNQISLDFTSLPDIKDDHPLLWEFTDLQCELYFAGQVKEPAKLFHDLYKTHIKLFGNYQCFNVSFGEEADYFQPFQFSSGLLAEGPKKLMKLYSDCLKRHNLDFTLIGERPANLSEGEQSIERCEEMKILFLGNSYIIAEEFSFKKVQ